MKSTTMPSLVNERIERERRERERRRLEEEERNKVSNY